MTKCKCKCILSYYFAISLLRSMAVNQCYVHMMNEIIITPLCLNCVQILMITMMWWLTCTAHFVCWGMINKYDEVGWCLGSVCFMQLHYRFMWMPKHCQYKLLWHCQYKLLWQTRCHKFAVIFIQSQYIGLIIYSQGLLVDNYTNWHCHWHDPDLCHLEAKIMWIGSQSPFSVKQG